MARMNMVQALNSAMDVMLARDENVVVFGEDVGYFGGVFRCTEGLQSKYGPERAFDTPIAEAGILAAAVSVGGRIHRAHHGARALRRRHLRRTDAQLVF